MKHLLLLGMCLSFFSLWSQDKVISLYPEGIPCENDLQMEVREVRNTGRRIMKVHNPELAVYLPAPGKANGSSVVICPGGGYTVLAWDWEGTWMAEWFADMGVTAFVLKYRLPHWESESCHDKVALMDAQRALRTVRMKASEYSLDKDRVGVMGFSAGGHLASSISTHFDDGNRESNLPVEHFSCRPDFSILMYPVISMDTSFTHMGSRRNLIGENPSEEMVGYYSNEKQISAETPPTILIHASDDRAVPVENSIAYYESLLKFDVPASLLVYESGGHGFSFAKGKGAVAGWPDACKSWLEDQGILTKKLKALIIEGQNNHKNWMETTPILSRQLEETGLFLVDVVRTPAEGESMASFAPDFNLYDVVVSNYNGDPWPESTKLSFERYVESGGGFVSVHAADNAFPEWKAYNEMIGIGGWYGRTEKDGPYVYINDEGEVVRDDSPGKGGHHGSQHSFIIETRDETHPIMAGLPDQWLHTRDELYDQLRGPAVNLHVLASAYSDPDTGGTGRSEPMLMAIHYGLGRSFHTTLGHLNESMHCMGFKTTFQRGCEWAATGMVTQPVPDSFPGTDEVSMEDH